MRQLIFLPVTHFSHTFFGDKLWEFGLDLTYLSLLSEHLAASSLTYDASQLRVRLSPLSTQNLRVTYKFEEICLESFVLGLGGIIPLHTHLFHMGGPGEGVITVQLSTK